LPEGRVVFGGRGFDRSGKRRILLHDDANIQTSARDAQAGSQAEWSD
jgi:hypothetical protein